MERLFLFAAILCVSINTAVFAQDDLFKEMKFTSPARSNSIQRSNTQRYTQKSNQQHATRKSVSNYPLPDNFEYYFATSDKKMACKVLYSVSTCSSNVVVPVGVPILSPMTLRIFTYTSTEGSAISSTSGPVDKGNYWMYTQTLVGTTVAVYVKKDFSEVKIGSIVYKIRISENDYKSIARRSAEWRTKYNSNIPVNSNSNVSNGTTLKPVTIDVYHPTKAVCKGCSGSGRCTTCRGTGEIVVTTLYSTSVHSCDICHGARTCRVCYGKGYID